MREIGIRLAVAATAAAAIASTSSAQVVTLFHQGFELAPNSPSITTNATNVGGVLTGLGRVYAGTGNGDVGYTTLWVDTQNSFDPGPPVLFGPLNRGGAFGDSSDFIGRTGFTGGGSPNSYLPSNLPAQHGFEFNDGDGITKLQLQNLDTAGATSRSLDFSYWVRATTWEPDDSFKVFLSDGTTTLTALNLVGTALDGVEVFDTGPPASWTPNSFAIPDSFGSIFTVSIEVEHNSGSENIFVDEISVKGIPSPGTLALLGMGGLLAGRRRRH